MGFISVIFLEFCRPLQPLWKPGLLIRWFRPPIGVLVPLVHEGEHSGTLLPASTAAIRATHKFMPCGRRTTHPHHNHRRTKQPLRKSLSTSVSNSRRTARNTMSNGLHRAFSRNIHRIDRQVTKEQCSTAQGSGRQLFTHSHALNLNWVTRLHPSSSSLVETAD